MKLSINNLILEVTRKCNMTCDHCLRGDQQNKEISDIVINKLLENVDNITSVTFTGGEPSLNTKSINYFLNQCKIKNISIGSFYIATNGKKYNNDFLHCLIDLYNYADEKEICMVQISRSDYHNAEQNEFEIDKLKAFNFFSERDYLKNEYLIFEGKTKENWLVEEKKNNIFSLDVEIYNDNINVDGDFYINVNGDLVSCCNLSYKRQSANKICNVIHDDVLKVLQAEHKFINVLETV